MSLIAALAWTLGCAPPPAPDRAAASDAPDTTGGWSTSPSTGTSGTPTDTAIGAPGPGCYSAFSPGGGSFTSIVRLADVDYQWTQVLFSSNGTSGHALAWFDDRWFLCGSGPLTWFDPVTGDVTENSDVQCQVMLVHDGRLGMMMGPTEDRWFWFTSGPDVAAFTNYDVVYEPDWPNFTRATSAGRYILAAHHATDRIMRIDPTTDTQGPDIVLQGFDSWIMGLAVYDGVLRLLDDGRQDPDLTIYIRDFDMSTGEELRKMALGNFVQHTYSGLWCVE